MVFIAWPTDERKWDFGESKLILIFLSSLNFIVDAATRIQEKPVSTGVITTIVVCSVLFVIIVLAAAFCYKRKLDEKYAPFLKPNRYFQVIFVIF